MSCVWCLRRLFIRGASGRQRYSVLGAWNGRVALSMGPNRRSQAPIGVPLAAALGSQCNRQVTVCSMKWTRARRFRHRPSERHTGTISTHFSDRKPRPGGPAPTAEVRRGGRGWTNGKPPVFDGDRYFAGWLSLPQAGCEAQETPDRASIKNRACDSLGLPSKFLGPAAPGLKQAGPPERCASDTRPHQWCRPH